jgi:hypothetical protein
MKRTTLSLALIQSVVFVGAANAAFIDAPQGEGGSGSLTFGGKINNLQPVWKYEVAPSVQGLNLEAKNGVAKGSYLEFTLSQSDVDILKGVTKNVIQDSNRPGLQPVITFGSGSGAITWDTSTPGGFPSTQLALDVNRDGSSIGELSMSIKGEMASNIYVNGNSYIDKGSYVNGNLLNAYQLLESQSYYATTYVTKADGSLFAFSTDNYAAMNSSAYLNNPQVSNYSGALVATASSFKLKVMSSSAKGSWSTTLPITIVQK